MGYIVRMPSLGMQMDRGEVITWHVRTGDRIVEGDTLVTIESEKATADVEATADGVLRQVYVEETGTAEPGEPLAIVAGSGEDIESLEREAEARAPPRVEDDTELEANAPTDADSGGIQDGSRPPATPRARRRAEALGVDLATVSGSAPNGGIVERDVEAAAVSASGPMTPMEERELSGVRKTIADRLGESYHEAIHVTETREVEVEDLFTAAESAGVSVTDVVLLAVTEALDAYPEFNAHIVDGRHQLFGTHDIALAVDAEGGLVAPVLRDVGSRSLDDLASTRRELTERARSGDQTPADLAEATFTVSNLGPMGVDAFTPIINPPQIAVLGVGRARQRAVPDEAGGVTFRRHLVLSLSFDHRVVDGADAARFLGSIADALEDASQLVEKRS